MEIEARSTRIFHRLSRIHLVGSSATLPDRRDVDFSQIARTRTERSAHLAVLPSHRSDVPPSLSTQWPHPYYITRSLVFGIIITCPLHTHLQGQAVVLASEIEHYAEARVLSREAHARVAVEDLAAPVDVDMEEPGESGVTTVRPSRYEIEARSTVCMCRPCTRGEMHRSLSRCSARGRAFKSKRSVCACVPGIGGMIDVRATWPSEQSRTKVGRERAMSRHDTMSLIPSHSTRRAF